jgi:serine/threonine protein kinase
MIRIMGTPTEKTWPGVTGLPDYKDCFPKWHGSSLEKMMPSLPPEGIGLLKRMLTYDPAARISALEAMKHPYFKGYSVGSLVSIDNYVPKAKTK